MVLFERLSLVPIALFDRLLNSFGHLGQLFLYKVLNLLAGGLNLALQAANLLGGGRANPLTEGADGLLGDEESLVGIWLVLE